jgi:hypothetical protein
VVNSSEEQEIPRGQPGIVDGIYRPMPAASSSSSANVLPTLIKLIPVESTTSKESSWLKLRIDLASIYYVVWIGVGIVQLLVWLQPHIQDIKEAVTDLTVPFEQLMERVANTPDKEHPQPTPKNEHHEKSGNPPMILSEGD